MNNKHTIEFFDERAEKWDEAHPPASPERLQEVVDLAALHRGSSAMDVGSGTGVLIPTLKQTVGDEGQILALDPSQGMITVLTRKHSDKSVATVVKTLEEYNASEESFDAIICFSCFPHIADKALGIANAYRMLKTGGRFVIAHLSSHQEINEFHKKAGAAVHKDMLPNEEKMRSMLADVGFTTSHFTDEPGRYELVAIK
jgi:ubiquinone/menaquinone biosynthesis C-methylase UbiE